MLETFTKQCFSLKIPAFLGVYFTNERKYKNIGEQLPKMAGAEKKNSQKGSKGGLGSKAKKLLFAIFFNALLLNTARSDRRAYTFPCRP